MRQTGTVPVENRPTFIRRRSESGGDSSGEDAGTEPADSDTPADRPDSILVSDARLSGGPIALDRTLGRVPGASLTPDHHTVSESGERTLYLAATDVSRERFEDAVAPDPTVVDAEHVATFPDSLTYRLRLSEGAVLLAPTSTELGARVVSVRGHHGQWNARLQFPDREVLVALQEFCTERGIDCGVDSLYRTDPGSDLTTDLTEGQREALRTAFEAGYYEIPRRATQDDLAAALGISTSAVSHRIRRATGQLVEESFTDLGDD